MLCRYTNSLKITIIVFNSAGRPLEHNLIDYTHEGKTWSTKKRNKLSYHTANYSTLINC